MKPRIAFYDLENAPSLGWYYDRYKEGNIVANEKDWFLLSFAWQWVGEKTVHVRALCDYPGYAKNKTDDTNLIRDLWKLFDEADILVAHNGDAFDKKKANTRFWAAGLKPPSDYKTIDTLKAARRVFKLDSNRLDAIGEFLRIGGKLPTTGWATWRACIDGDPKAWTLLKRYNKRDVTLLGQVYEMLKPWIPNHPDLRVYDDRPGCPSCLSMNVQRRGVRVQKSRRYERFQCQDCGAWSTGAVVK